MVAFQETDTERKKDSLIRLCFPVDINAEPYIPPGDPYSSGVQTGWRVHLTEFTRTAFLIMAIKKIEKSESPQDNQDLVSSLRLTLSSVNGEREVASSGQGVTLLINTEDGFIEGRDIYFTGQSPLRREVLRALTTLGKVEVGNPEFNELLSKELIKEIKSGIRNLAGSQGTSI